MLRLRLLLSILFAFAFVPLFSQLTDDFSDGNFNVGPQWNGTTTVWDASNFLLELNASGAVPTTLATLYYLSTDYLEPSLDSTSWEFDINFTTSLQTNNNYAEVYLTSDITNLSGAVNGYFVRLMNGSTTAQGNRKISLWKSVNGTKSVLIDGQDNVFSATNLNFRILVTRDAANNWTLMHDSTQTGNFYVTEGSIIDAQFNSSAFCGIRERHTAQSRNDWVSLDNVTVQTFAAQDVTAPTVVSVSVLNSTQLEVEFNENVDVATATTTSSYARMGNIQPTGAAVNISDSARVTLTFASLQNCISDSLIIQNVADRSANVMLNDTLPFIYCMTATAGFKDVVINEIFADPTPDTCGHPIAEFVELFNTSTSAVNLKGWTITVGSDEDTICTTDCFLLGGEYVILTEDSAWLAFTPQAIVMSNLPSLLNSGDTIVLKNEVSLTVDSLAYYFSQYASGMTQGYSLEVINPLDSCASLGNLSSSNDSCQSTPGAINSIYDPTLDSDAPYITSVTITGSNTIQVCFNEPLDTISGDMPANFTISTNGPTTWTPTVAAFATPQCVNLTLPAPLIEQDTIYTVTTTGVTDCNGNDTTSSGTFLDASPFSYKDIIINEIFSDDNSPICNRPEDEFIELYNRSNRPVDLQGWQLKYDGGAYRLIALSYILNPGAYVILAEDTTWRSITPAFLEMSNFPSLINGDGEIGLYDPDSILIDTVNYVPSFWLPDSGPNDTSTELVNPNDTCSTIGNWMVSMDPCNSTPGAQNSVYDPTLDTTAPAVISVTVVATDSLLVCFDGTMNLASLENAALYAIDTLGGNNPVFPVFASGVAPGYACVYLVLSSPIDIGVFYTLTTTMLADCAGNDTTQIDTFVLGGAPAACQVLISEFLADEDELLPLPDANFIELFNGGTTAVELFNWTFVRNGGSPEAPFPRYTLNPGEYLIVCDDNPDVVAAYSVFGKPVLGVDFPQMNIGSDNIELFDASNNLVDRIFYTEDWYNQDDVPKGVTYERKNLNLCCLDEHNWHASEDPRGGTPGEVNSVNDPSYMDTVLPEVTSIQILNNGVIRILFSEIMDAASVQILANYSFGLNGMLPTGTFLSFQEENNVTFIDVQLPFLMDSNTVYCVTISGVTDCPGNAIASAEHCFGLPTLAVPGDVVINEILFDAKTGGSRYVELYNNSEKIVDLSTLHITERDDDDGTVIEVDPITATQMLLLPGSYICFTENPAFQDSIYGPLQSPETVVFGKIPAVGKDDECVVYIDSVTSNILDELQYDDAWHFPNLDSDDGVSLERIRFGGITTDENNWHSAASVVNYGTPGYKNSEAYMPEIMPEVWLSPETFSPDQDGVDDFVFVNYNFSTPGWQVTATVYDGKGRLVRTRLENALAPTDTATATGNIEQPGVVKWDGANDGGRKVDIGVYVIVVEAVNLTQLVGETRTYKLGCVVAAR